MTIVSSETPYCWAHMLGGCSGRLSREHLISASLFPDSTSINVTGFSWCGGGTKTIGLSNLTSKILCTTHNSLLSPLDAAAGAAFRALSDSALLANSRLSVKPSKFKIRHFHINGPLLERWLLKTLINLCYESGLLIGRDGRNAGVPAENLVRICFEKEPFPGKSGLYLAARKGGHITSGPEVRFAPLIYDETHVLGGFFHFRGFLLFISLIEEPLPSNFDWVIGTDSNSQWAQTEPTWHFKKIKHTVNHVHSHVVHFDW